MKTNLNRIIDSKEDAEQWLTDLRNEFRTKVIEIDALESIVEDLQVRISALWKDRDEIGMEIAEHPDYKEPEREQEDPERKVWSAMQGGTDGG